MTAHGRVGLVLSLLLLSATGCDELTEVVLVVDSDLAIPGDVDWFDLTIAPGPIAPIATNFFVMPPAPPIQAFPLSVGFVSSGETASFSFVARLFINIATSTPELVVSRTVSEVRFASGQTRMLRLSLPRACACDGTSCPLPGDPLCENLRNPILEPFDPAAAPPNTMMPRPQQVFF